MIPHPPPAPPPKRKKSRKPTSLTSDLISSTTTGLRYPPQLLHQARTGHTPLLSIPQLHSDVLAHQAALALALRAVPRPVDVGGVGGVDLSTEGMGVETPWQVIQRCLREEVAAVGDHIQVQAREAQEKAQEEQKTKEGEDPQRTAQPRGRKTRAAREQSSTGRGSRKRRSTPDEEKVSAAAADERKEDAQEGKDGREEEVDTREERTVEEEKGGQGDGDAVKEEGDLPVKRRRLRGPLIPSSLSSISTASSPSQLSAGLPLPDSFGARMPSYSALVAALMPPPSLPRSIFPSLVDHNAVTNELFLHRLQQKLAAAASPAPTPPPSLAPSPSSSSASPSPSSSSSSSSPSLMHPTMLPLHLPLVHFYIYASSSERKQQELILHAHQPLSTLLSSIRCPHPPTHRFLHLERTLYTDSPPTVQPIIEWLSAYPDHPLYPPEVRGLDAEVGELEVRLGSHYLYHHGQDCCHVVVVGEVRFVSERWDVREGAVYPLEVYVRHERKRRCGACRLFASQYAVYDDMLCVDNPTFLCEHCYRRLHYDEEGQLLYSDFKVYKV